MCERVDSSAEAEGLGTTIPLSPGLLGWPVAIGTAPDLRALGHRLGRCQVDRGYMMIPKKSTSLVIGVGTDVEHVGESCDYCSMAATCRFREEHISHHG